MKWPVEVGHECKRNKGFLRLEEDSGKGQAAVRIAQSSGVAQFGAGIAWKEREVGQRRVCIAEVWKTFVTVQVMV